MDRYRATESLDFDGELHRLPPTFAVTLPTGRRIGVRDIVDRFCPMGSCPGLSHGECAEFMVTHLLQAPKRQPLYKLEEWAEEHSAELIYGEASSKFNESRMGRALDAMSESITDIETAVVAQAVSVYKVDTQAIHWDLTHVTFTGAYDEIDEIGPGYGGGRLHEKQVKVSLHATNDGGIPVRHQVIPGGDHQAPYAPAMLKDQNGTKPNPIDALAFVLNVAKHPKWYVYESSNSSGVSYDKKEKMESKIRELEELHAEASVADNTKAHFPLMTKEQFLEETETELERLRGMLQT